ncbi:LANO_0H15148g1_1 [Lachancea nothofagi CBS 11611]|uniref:GrpE protein homolog n=1 Tax=Lachancea nothofagi CBS 11611 TaxID=1266666 RepID=A0A1G4KMZ0_9SACH|nr:LANO_0H15148g1_1 [Lachancea nothofagi CBS 11611]
MIMRPAMRYLPTRLASSVGVRNATLANFSRPVVGFRYYSDAAKDAGAEASKTETTQESLSEDQLKIQELEKKLVAKDKESAEYKDRLLRSVADFRNLQEVTKKDVQKAKDYSLQKFAKDLLDSVDNFGHALQAFKPETVEASTEISDLYTGVKMTRDVFEKTLKKHGIEKLDPMGETFDPNKHEATFELPDPQKEPGTVFHVQQVGFTLNDRVIRPAKVGIVKDPSN